MHASSTDLLKLAEALARVKHAGQKRKGSGEPYFNHLLRVAERVEGTRRKTIAFLHDLIEDQNVSPFDLRNLGFPWDIIDDVLALTRIEESGNGSVWTETYLEFIERTIREGSCDALYVKLADLADNLHDDWPEAPSTLRARYIKADLMVRAALHRRGGEVAVSHAAVRQ